MTPEQKEERKKYMKKYMREYYLKKKNNQNHIL